MSDLLTKEEEVINGYLEVTGDARASVLNASALLGVVLSSKLVDMGGRRRIRDLLIALDRANTSIQSLEKHLYEHFYGVGEADDE